MFRLRPILIDYSLACFDLALTTLCYFALLRLEWSSPGGASRWPWVFGTEQGLALGWLLGIWLALLFYFGMYRSRRMDSVFADLSVLVKVSFAGFVVLEALAHFVPVLPPARLFPLHFAAVNLVFLGTARLGVRLLLREFRRRGHNTKNLVVVAGRDLGDRVCHKIARRLHYGYRISRRLEYEDPSAEAGCRLIETFREALRSDHVDDVILALPAEASALSVQIVAECERRGTNVRLVPDLFPLIQSDTQIYNLDGIPLLNVHLYPMEYFGYVVFKRAFDVVASLAVLLVLSPLFLILAVLIKLTSAGPVFFSQERVGLNGRKFRMLKFRTMRADPARDPATHWTTRDDPNVTAVGRWLRRSSLDELPQFFNVLAGDMSIVGPRPERPYFLERFREEIPEYMLRHYVKCGITGWAQVNGWRGDTSIRQRLAHDLYYMRNWALALDLKILLLTLTRSFFHRDAY